MTLSTRCPHCQTSFRVAADQLKLRAGLVRCGACKQVFNGVEHLLDDAGAEIATTGDDVAADHPAAQMGAGLDLDFIPFSQDDPDSAFPDDIPAPSDDGLDTLAADARSPAADADQDGEARSPHASADQRTDADAADPAANSDDAGDADEGAFDRAAAREDAAAAFGASSEYKEDDGKRDSDDAAETAQAGQAQADASDPWPDFADQAAGAAAQLQAAWAGHRAMRGDSDEDNEGESESLDGDDTLDDRAGAGAGADHDQHARVWRARDAIAQDQESAASPDDGFAEDANEQSAAAFADDSANSMDEAADGAADNAGARLASEHAEPHGEDATGAPGWPLPLTSSAPARSDDLSAQDGWPETDAHTVPDAEIVPPLLAAEPYHADEELPAKLAPVQDPLAPPPGQTLWSGDPEFVLQARRRQRRRRGLRIAMMAGSVLLLMAAATQATYYWRNQIAAALPGAKPALTALCARLHCQFGPAGDIRQMAIESNELQAVTQGGHVYMLTLTLRNRSASAQAWPSVELTLNDDNEQAVVKRVFAPKEYLPPALRATDSMPRDSEQQVRVSYELQQAVASGYRVYLFYP